MNAQLSTQVVTFLPQSIAELREQATYLSGSAMLPKSFQNMSPEVKVCSVMAAIQMGLEVGLSPMQAIQNIAVVNGQPTIWGDAQLGLVRASGLLEEYKEELTGDKGTNKYTAVVTVLRKGDKHPIVKSFSVEDAQVAGLMGLNGKPNKVGTWTTHPYLMLMYKARAFALRTAFPDVLKGLHSREEMEGEIIDMVPTSSYVAATPSHAITVAEIPLTEESNKKTIDDFKNEVDKLEKKDFSRNAPSIMDEARLVLNEEESNYLRSFIQDRFNELKDSE